MDRPPISESSQSAPVPLSVPPLGHPLRTQRFDTIDDLMKAYSEFAGKAGYGIYRAQASNPQIQQGKKVPGTYRRYTILCLLDSIAESKSTGVRRSSSKKHDCPFKIIAKCPASEGKWMMDFESPQCVLTHQGHGPQPTGHLSTFRGLNDDAKEIIEANADNPTVHNRSLVEQFRVQFPDMNFDPLDVKNARARARKANLGIYTHTQSMFKFLDDAHPDSGVKYNVKWKDDRAETGKFEGLYITHAFGDRMVQHHPYTVMFDNTYKTNKFNLAFFQVVVMTPFGNAASVACGLINTELQIGFDWLVQQYKAHRARITDQPLLVATTDSETALRNAIRALFPHTQLQLCKFHLNKNVALHISRKWKKVRQPGQNHNDNEDPLGQDEAGSQDQPPAQTQEEDDRIILTATGQEHLTAAENSQVRSLNTVIRSLETGGQPPLPTLQSDEIEYSKAGIWALWIVILTRATEPEFLEAWDTLTVIFHDQTALLKYFMSHIWPFRYEWALCHTRENLNFGQTTTSPVESINRLLKSMVVKANTTLDILVLQYIRMVCGMEEKYEEQLRRETTRAQLSILNKPEFALIKRKVAWKAIDLANGQVLKLQRFASGDRTINLDSTITKNQGIISAKALLNRHKEEKPTLVLEDFNPFWWLARNDDDVDKYLAIHDPDKVLSLKGRPHNTSQFQSDPTAPRIQVPRLPSSSASSAMTGIQPSARRIASSWETQDVIDLTSQPTGSSLTTSKVASTRGGRKRAAAPSALTRAKKRRAADTEDLDEVDLTEAP